MLDGVPHPQIRNLGADAGFRPLRLRLALWPGVSHLPALSRVKGCETSDLYGSLQPDTSSGLKSLQTPVSGHGGRRVLVNGVFSFLTDVGGVQSPGLGAGSLGWIPGSAGNQRVITELSEPFWGQEFLLQQERRAHDP